MNVEDHIQAWEACIGEQLNSGVLRGAYNDIRNCISIEIEFDSQVLAYCADWFSYTRERPKPKLRFWKPRAESWHEGRLCVHVIERAQQLSLNVEQGDLVGDANGVFGPAIGRKLTSVEFYGYESGMIEDVNKAVNAVLLSGVGWAFAISDGNLVRAELADLDEIYLVPKDEFVRLREEPPALQLRGKLPAADSHV